MINTSTIPTSRDIYLEVEGRRAAAVESYDAKAERTLYEIEELGNDSPAATLWGRTRYRLTLRRVQLVDPDLDFHLLSGFSLVIVKPHSRIVYSGCEWSALSESIEPGKPCIETVTLTAQRRIEL